MRLLSEFTVQLSLVSLPSFFVRPSDEEVELELIHLFAFVVGFFVSPEDLYRAVAHSDSVYGTLDLTERDECFCWCFWSYEVPVETLKDSSAIMVRAMDEVSLVVPPSLAT